MDSCLKTVNNCLEFLSSCKPKETNSNNSSPTNNSLLNSSKNRMPNPNYTLILPTRPKVRDEIRIKAKLNDRPKEFFLNLCVDSTLSPDNGEPAMIAFHFRTIFKHHTENRSYVVLNCKRGPSGWEEYEEEENTWIDDDVEEIDIKIKFTQHEVQLYSGDSNEYQFKHRYEIDRIDRLQIGGDLEYIEEVALRYAR